MIEFVPDLGYNEEEILVDVVPTKWISEDKQFCYYPPHSMRGKCTKLLMSLADYDSSMWDSSPLYTITVIVGFFVSVFLWCNFVFLI